MEFIEQFIKVSSNNRKCAIYVYPLLQVSTMLNIDLVKDIQITKDYSKLLVTYDGSIHRTGVHKHFEYVANYDNVEDDSVTLLLNIPKVFLSDVRKIMDGQYTKISNRAKDTILRNSPNRWNEDKRFFDVALIGLFPEREEYQNIRKMLAEYLVVDIKDIHEIISTPKLEEEVYEN